MGYPPQREQLKNAGVYKAIMWMPPHFLNVGFYTAGLALSTMSPVKVHFYEKEAIIFEVIEDINMRLTEYKSNIPGVVRPKLNWSIERK